jgi:purine nucleosidase
VSIPHHLPLRRAHWCTVRVHLDTDLGTDPDDACALAMLLGWPEVDVVAVTTSTDPGGQRAAYVEHCLALLGRADIPVVAGAAGSRTHDGPTGPVLGDLRYWPDGIAPRPSPAGAATQALRRSLDGGAVVVAVGPYTNLAVLERDHPGALAAARVVVMGGWVDAPRAGLPAWGPERDYNVQWDTQAARVVFETTADLTLSTLPVSLQAPLRRRDLGRLRGLGPMGELLARQSEAHGEDIGKSALGPAYAGLPDDLVNFHYDPLACAVAVGWPGAVVEERRLRIGMDGPVLRFLPDAEGRSARVVVDVDGSAFSEAWLSAVRTACRRADA